jgi:hypothetical protein
MLAFIGIAILLAITAGTLSPHGRPQIRLELIETAFQSLLLAGIDHLGLNVGNSSLASGNRTDGLQVRIARMNVASTQNSGPGFTPLIVAQRMLAVMAENSETLRDNMNQFVQVRLRGSKSPC